MNFVNLARRALSHSQQITHFLLANRVQNSNLIGKIRNLSITQVKYGDEAPKKDINEDVNKKLMEFFDEKKNWNEDDIKHGRSWELPELRIKSNTDLHKIWYVLLKEKNMLKTMEHEYKRAWRWWASPERIDKVDQSMRNLETVVRERNRAYYELETGESGERPGQIMSNQIGIREYRKFIEHQIPYKFNKKWREENKTRYYGFAVRKFLRRYREKIFLDTKRSKNRDRNHVIRLLSRHPNIDKNVIAQKFPSVNINALAGKDKLRGHFTPPVE